MSYQSTKFGQNKSNLIFEKTFGETIKALRENKKLPLREVASAVGIDISMLGKIEKDTRKPSKQLIDKLATFFEISSKELTVVFLSDKVAHDIMSEEVDTQQLLTLAEEKINYLKAKKKP